MKSIYDVQQILKRFGTYIYTGNRLGDLDLMSLEIKELYDAQFISAETYAMATLLILKESRKFR